MIFSKRTGKETEEDTDSLTDKLQGSAVVLIDHLDLLLAMDDTRMFLFLYDTDTFLSNFCLMPILIF